MPAHKKKKRRKRSLVLGFIFQSIVASIIVGLMLLAVGSLIDASAGIPGNKADEEHSWVRQIIKMSIVGAEASEHGSDSGGTG